tara:strand:- start:23238 stop:23525 length:288 start_codon:yes stop_codon:yes gene_type:complete
MEHSGNHSGPIQRATGNHISGTDISPSSKDSRPINQKMSSIVNIHEMEEQATINSALLSRALLLITETAHKMNHRQQRRASALLTEFEIHRQIGK